MNKRLLEIIKYKTGGRQNVFAELMGWSPQYLVKLLKGGNFGLSPVLRVVERIPELNVRWFLTGDGAMLSDEGLSSLRHQAVSRAEAILSLERLIPVMDAGELRLLEAVVCGDAPLFSPEVLASLECRASSRPCVVDGVVAMAMAKSDELCKTRTAKKS